MSDIRYRTFLRRQSLGEWVQAIGYRLVLFGMWSVNSGSDFQPESFVAVTAGGFVRRVPIPGHYDSVKKDARSPAAIAMFGNGPVEIQLADPKRPGWRQL